MNGHHVLQLKAAAERAVSINKRLGVTLKIELTPSNISINASGWSDEGSKLETGKLIPWKTYLESRKPANVLNDAINVLVQHVVDVREEINPKEESDEKIEDGIPLGDCDCRSGVPVWQRGAGYGDQ